ncbi:hypothetical protein MASR2M15_11880 [Anaerolineales bacterium]
MSSDAIKDYLKNQQYKDSRNLDARIRLHRLFGVEDKPIPAALFDDLLAIAPENARILVLGAGSGNNWTSNLDRIPKGWDVTLTDLSEGILDVSRAKIGEHPQIKFKVMDAEANSYEDDSFDVVTAHYMLYHVPNLQQALEEIRRVLKKDGVLLAITNSAEHMQELFDLITRNSDSKVLDMPIETLTGLRHLNFEVENGEEILKQVFSQVEFKDYKSYLKVTDIEAVMDYIASMNTFWNVDIRGLFGDKIRADLENILQQEGYFHINRRSGLFVARQVD